MRTEICIENGFSKGLSQPIPRTQAQTHNGQGPAFRFSALIDRFGDPIRK